LFADPGVGKVAPMDAIALLKQDHKTVCALFRRFEHTALGAMKAQGDLAARIIEELSRHAAIEEQLFYPAVRETFPDDEEYVLEALEEHHAAKSLLAEIDRLSPTHERFRAKLMVLIESVERHIEEEELTVFPELRRAMGRKQIAELGRALEAAKATAPTKPHPHLPDAPPLQPLVGVAAGVVDLARTAGESALKRIRC
jgi:hemerythrin-like domain-containing protein